MNFDLSEEQRMLQSTIDQFLEDQCPVGTVRDFYDTQDELIPGVWKGLAEMGVAGLPIPEQYGGAGLALLDLQCAADRLGYHATPVPAFAHAVASLAIVLGGSQGQKESWLPRLASGDSLATIAFAEPDGRWQPEDWTLVPTAEGTLTGIRASVPAGRAADLVVVGLAGGQARLGRAQGVRRHDRALPRSRPHAPRLDAHVRTGPDRAPTGERRNLRAAARRGARAAGRRCGRRDAALCRARGRLREAARAIRPNDWPFPGAQASARQSRAR